MVYRSCGTGADGVVDTLAGFVVEVGDAVGVAGVLLDLVHDVTFVLCRGGPVTCGLSGVAATERHFAHTVVGIIT